MSWFALIQVDTSNILFDDIGLRNSYCSNVIPLKILGQNDPAFQLLTQPEWWDFSLVRNLLRKIAFKVMLSISCQCHVVRSIENSDASIASVRPPGQSSMKWAFTQWLKICEDSSTVSEIWCRKYSELKEIAEKSEWVPGYWSFLSQNNVLYFKHPKASSSHFISWLLSDSQMNLHGTVRSLFALAD